MRALVTGAGGQLAQQLIAVAPPGLELKAVDRAECDITAPKVVERVFNSFRPDVVINAAAFTAVDAAEDSREAAFRVNAQGAQNVARSAKDVGARLIHISTDYVFDGHRSSPYPWDAPTNPLNVYGASKLAGEELIRGVGSTPLIVRAGWLYSLSGKSFLVKMLALMNGSRTVRVVNDQVGCPTSAREFAAVLWKANDAKLQGVYHWANLGAATWYDFALEIARLAQQLAIRSKPPEIVGVTSEEYGGRANRPRYSVLDSSALATELRTSPGSWQDALRTELTRFA